LWRRKEGGKVKITKKHETPTRVGGVRGGGVGLATGLVVAVLPFAAIGGGLLAATAINADGGVNGYAIEIVACDTKKRLEHGEVVCPEGDQPASRRHRRGL
jgi:hypothetical protein